jgi:hypothetical protein
MPDVTKEKYPKRLWLAGPAPYVAQDTVFVPKSHKRLKFIDGSVVVHDAEEEAVIRTAMGNAVYEETPGFAEVHPKTGWPTTSNGAYIAHTKVVEQ